MMKSIPKQLIPFLWFFIKPYRGLMITLFITGFLWGIQTSLSPYLLKLIIDRTSAFTGNKAQIFSVIAAPTIGYVLVWSVMAMNFRLVDWVRLKLFPNIRRDITNAMFSYLNRHSYRYMQDSFAGTLSNKIMDMAGGIGNILVKVDEVAANTFAFLIALIAMYFVNPIFSLILFLWATTFVSITLLFNKKTKFLSKDFSESKSLLSGRIVDAITNLTNVRLFAHHTYENNLLNQTVNTTVYKDRAMQWYVLKMRIFWDFTFITLITLMLSALIYLYGKGKITVGDFAFIMTLALNIFMHLWYIAGQFVLFAEELGKCSQALSLIVTPHEIMDVPNASSLKVTKGDITFDNVTFHYQKGHKLFENKHVHIKGGSKVGLVGFSGSGKTTFVNLILRLFEVESGCILIDGQDISTVTQDSLHQKISMIPQDPQLFHRSLMENIRYGKLTATDEEVIEAAKITHCHEFITMLPDGYDSLVGERGIKLSGGQRQRIAIARTWLKNAPILILDEATSALDSVTEKYIQEGLKKLMENNTTIVIAHRLSTLSTMERILVFDKGHIIEEGSHEQLLARGGHYARMWHMQAGGFMPEVEK